MTRPSARRIQRTPSLGISGDHTDLRSPSGQRAPDDSVSDGTLLSRLRADDTTALDALLERYWSAIFSFVLRTTGSRDAAAEVAQDVFCRLWERRASWRTDGSVRALLFRLARNGAVSRHRRERARERAASAFGELSLHETPPTLPAEDAELRSALETAIGALPARRREVFTLRVQDELSYKEIAEIMGTSTQTVANQMSRALATLRANLNYLID